MKCEIFLKTDKGKEVDILCVDVDYVRIIGADIAEEKRIYVKSKELFIKEIN